MFGVFTSEDQVIARSLLKRLPPRQRKAIVLRFWHNYSIFEVAKALRISWGEADQVIKHGLVKMKKDCMKNPRFSRALKLAMVA